MFLFCNSGFWIVEFIELSINLVINSTNSSVVNMDCQSWQNSDTELERKKYCFFMIDNQRSDFSSFHFWIEFLIDNRIRYKNFMIDNPILLVRFDISTFHFWIEFLIDNRF